MKFKTVDNIVYRIVTIVRYCKYKRNHVRQNRIQQPILTITQKVFSVL